MKLLLFLSTLFLTTYLPAKGQGSRYFAIDQAAQQTSAATPDSLALKLTQSYRTDREKVRSIFAWITHHIAYDMQRFVRGPVQGRFRATAPVDTLFDSRSLNERVAYGVMKKRRAVCDGYARLFETLCSYAGIGAVTISGYARADGNSGGTRFATNHSWNAVYLDSNWHLLDVTWASGYVISGKDEFVQSLDEFYFLTPPEKFGRNHVPESLEWTLLAHAPAVREYDFAPFRPMAFLKYKISAFTPSKGTIEAAVGDTIKVALQFSELTNETGIAANSAPDFLPPYRSSSWVYLRPPTEKKARHLTYTYVVSSPDVEWLNIVYNDDVVLRYKVVVKGRALQAP